MMTILTTNIMVIMNQKEEMVTKDYLKLLGSLLLIKRSIFHKNKID